MPGRAPILCTVFLDALGYGLLIPVLPGIVRRFGTDPAFVSQVFGWFIASFAVVQFLAAPLLGSLSDRYGRRPVLLASLLGAAVDYLLMAFAPTLPLLFLGRVISGATSASIAVAHAYVADISDDKSRSGNFGLVAAALGVGIVAGPGLGGALAQIGAKTPFLVAAGLNLLNLGAAWFLLPESLTTERRRKALRWTPIVSLRPLVRREALTRLFWCYGLVCLAGRATSTMWALFTEQRFGWSPVEIGASFAFIGLVMAVAQALLPRYVVGHLGERRTLRSGLVVSTAAYLAIAVVTQGWLLYGVVALSAFSAVVSPALLSVMSRAVPPDGQGELQGSLASIASLTAIAGPLVYTRLFALGLRSEQERLLTGAPFVMAAALSALAWLLVVSARNERR